MGYKTKTILTALLLLNIVQINLNAQQVYEISAKEAVDIAFKNVNDLKNATQESIIKLFKPLRPLR